MTLTEKWKKGELDRGIYYIKEQGTYKTDEWHGNCWEDSWSENIEEVLAPVPSYEDWVYLHKARNDAHEIVESLTKENKQLKEDIRYGFAVDDVVMERMDKLKAENQQLRKWCEEFNALDVAQENQQLKEMLYKCREKLDWLNGGYDVWGGELTDFIEEIDNAIGEKK